MVKELCGVTNGVEERIEKDVSPVVQPCGEDGEGKDY